MASFLRKHNVRVLALAVVVAAVAVAVGALLNEWTIAAIAATAMVVCVAALILAVSRRQHRAMNRVNAELHKVLLSVDTELKHGRQAMASVAELRHVLTRIEDRQEQDSATLEGSSVVQVRTEGALDSLKSAQETTAKELGQLIDEQRRADKRQEQRLSRTSSALLSESQALLQLMESFHPTEPLPTVGGWALSPSGIVWLTRYIAHAKPHTIVECGSGTSTLWCAMALRRNGHGRLVAMDHKPDFAAKTREALARHGLSDWAQVIDAPLVPTSTPRGTFDWYDTTEVDVTDVDLLLVDGPPQATGKHARYPALHVFEKKLAASAALLLDDTHREDERECVEIWLDETPGLSMLTASIPDVALLEYRRP